jgi:hypothetical protein
MLAETPVPCALTGCVELTKLTRLIHIGKNFLAKIRSQTRPKTITLPVAGMAVTQ